MRGTKATDDQLGIDFSETPAPLPPTQLMTPSEIFDSSDEALLRQLLEDGRIERKSAGMHSKPLAEYYSMWANTPDGGIIVIGVTKERQFEGCSCLSQDQLNELEKIGSTFCPEAVARSRRVAIHRDRDGADDFLTVVFVEYHPTRVVKTTDGRAFRRVGDTKREVKGEELRHLQAEKGEIRFESEPCNLPYPDEFDMKYIGDFAERVRARRGWDARHSLEQILELMYLGKRVGGRFIPNVACAILFSRDPRAILPGCQIRFLRFSGETQGSGTSWNAVKDEDIEGTIAEQIDRAAEIVKSQLRTFSALGTGGKFVTSPEYPEWSWYEAIVNACVHRSYGNGLRNMPIYIRMFEDRLEIESPGPFPAFVTPENIYATHNPRNPYLMASLRQLEFVKCAAEGTRRIRDTMRDAQLPPPEFTQRESDCATVRVVLRNDIHKRKMWIEADVVEILGAQMADALTEDEKRFISFAAKNGQISVSDAERLAHVTWGTARKMLMRLVKRGVFNHEHREDIVRDSKARFKLRGYSRG